METAAPSRVLRSKRKVPNSIEQGPTPTAAKKTRKGQDQRADTQAKVIELPHNLGTLAVPAPIEGFPSYDTKPISTNTNQQAGASWTIVDAPPQDSDQAFSLESPQEELIAREVGIAVEISNSESVKGAKSTTLKQETASKTTAVRRKPKPAFNETPFPDWEYPTVEQCEEVSRLLSSIHGEVKAPETIPLPSLTISGCGEVPSVLDALIRTLLSGATTGNNSAMAFQGLVKRFGVLQDGVGKGSVDWNKVRHAPVGEIRDAIKSGGLADIKSKHIKEILTMVYEENIARRNELQTDGKAKHGNRVDHADEHMLSLDYMHALSKDEAMQRFIKYPGIGVKTAACVVLFCLRRPCFAVDTHVFRLSKWLGWIPSEKVNEITAFRHLEVRVPDHLKYSLHQLFIFHGKECPRCRAMTGVSSEGWEKGCVIDHLVKRTGKRKPSESLFLCGSSKSSFRYDKFPKISRGASRADHLEMAFDGAVIAKPRCDEMGTACVWIAGSDGEIQGIASMEAVQSFVSKCLSLTLAQILSSGLVLLSTWIAARATYSYTLAWRERPVSFTVPLPPEVSPDWQGKAWDEVDDADKEILESQSFGKFDESKILSYCPADGRLLGDENGVKPASPEKIDLTVRRAVVAQFKWKRTTFAERRRVLRTLLKYILEHQDEIVTACCLDSGKTKVDACFGEILVTAEKLKWTINHGENSLRTDSRPTNLLMMYKKNTVRYEPLGVITACVSWNYPFHNFISPVISAIFAGNSIIVKPSEHTAWSSTFFYNLIREAIVSCGYSEYLVQSLVCLPQHADVLTSHPKVDHIVFIGSRPVAHAVCKSAAKSLTPVTVELGGKDPVIVLDDPSTLNDIASVASVLLRGVFQSAGQNCVGAERIIALPRAYNKILEIVTPRIKALRLGSVLLDSRQTKHDPDHKPGTPDVGAVISQRSFDLLEALISEAVGQGAKLICGGKRHNHPNYPRGHYFTPTLLANVTREMRVAQMELFAPVFLLMRATDVYDAVSIANSTEYALGASVFGHRKREVEYCVSNLNAGMVAVNDFGVYYAVGLPFGGLKGSGYGRFGGAEGLRNLSNLKAVSVDGWPFIQTKIPPTLDYPIQKGDSAKMDGRGAWEMCKGVVETGYHPSISGKARGIQKILKNI
ncbi:predicted protein [Uncinocarpus reesii 1704]|uniref:aldehyde dehydrogenase (NAD(+)) n=1 Tax=Uncinocarpus reesii (strain UAMH 1704) TaxID=336963 RepID=C4JR88_UNCRE|nr:uncharacterized protein UREG_03570 [Uncinocarpus reesii 1704]EEP78724.1 predicted protein [Uncinocarpus reesii 1704]